METIEKNDLTFVRFTNISIFWLGYLSDRVYHGHL